ncbi:MAG TPA: sigma factor-like helix-turn-helix DNA-binding protein, partial [Chitinophagaceae bacterium]|nr:sigma factor-like helix-turn-helix DNA-binding protein [Chitinophagaceae bacterium]
SWLEKKRLVLPGVLYGADDDPESFHADAAGGIADESDGPLLQKQRAVILQEEIDRLPPVYRTLITLYHQEEISYGEMAQITALPEGSVKSYLFRARKMLKENVLSKYKKEAL